MSDNSYEVYNFFVMTKIRNLIGNTKTANNPHRVNVPLDTLAQLATSSKPSLKINKLENLKKRAKAKYISDKITLKLADLQSTKKGKQPFYNTYHCSRLIEQNGKTITSRYCNNRWCVTCNRIRAGKLINGYKQSLTELKNSQFVTLTIPNVHADDLSSSIDLMYKNITRIRKVLQKNKMKMKGIRKLEITYNSRLKNYHPHFHLILESKEVAEEVVKRWLRHYVNAKRIAQDIRPTTKNSAAELFKYFTKMFTKQGVNIRSLNVMIKALKGRRVIQSIGIKKYVSEDVEEIVSQEYEELVDADFDVWEFVDYDWYSQKQGNELCGYKPSEILIELSKMIY